MSDNGAVSPHAQKRLPMEIARDRALVAELHYKGWTDRKIRDLLNSRPDVSYELSLQSVYNDRKVTLEKLLEEGQENTALWLQEEILRLNIVEKEAWIGFKKSTEGMSNEKITKTLEPVYDYIKNAQGKEVKTKVKDELVISRIEKVMYSGAGDSKWLLIILDCIEKRGKLRGLYKFQARIETDTEIRVKTYHSWSPERWIEKEAVGGEVPEIVEGEVLKAIEDGDH